MNTLSLELWAAWFVWLSEDCYASTCIHIATRDSPNRFVAPDLFDAVMGKDTNERFARAVWLAEQMDWIE